MIATLLRLKLLKLLKLVLLLLPAAAAVAGSTSILLTRTTTCVGTLSSVIKSITARDCDVDGGNGSEAGTW